jgi:hypothetical protein
MSSSPPSSSSAVRVACRVRPRVPRADLTHGVDALDLSTPSTVVAVDTLLPHLTRKIGPEGGFAFDTVLPPAAGQGDVFAAVGAPMVDAALAGFNATIFAYGQTGSGKTFTMTGTPSNPGVVPRAVAALFAGIAAAPSAVEFTVRCLYVEIYMERVRDLLAAAPPHQSWFAAQSSHPGLAIRQEQPPSHSSSAPGGGRAHPPTQQHPAHGLAVFVEGANEPFVSSADELLALVRAGDANRVTGVTGMNEASSRSHAVLVITVDARDTQSGVAKSSRLSLVDLAGSEQVARTGAEGHVLEEAKQINKSLFTLSKCISALAAQSEAEAKGAASAAASSAAAAGKRGASAGSAGSAAAAAPPPVPAPPPPHIPFRDSKLTRLLQDSLGGNARTSLIICVSPCSSNLAETVSTLRFGALAKTVRTRPVVNKKRTPEELERLLAKAEIAIDAQARLITMLQARVAELEDGWGDRGSAASPPPAGQAAPASPPSLTSAGAAAASADGPVVEEVEDAWGDPDTWSATSPLKSPGPPRKGGGGGGGGGGFYVPPLSPLVEASSSTGPLHLPGSASAPASGAALAASPRTAAGSPQWGALLTKLTALEEEVTTLHAQRARDGEDLASLRDEHRSACADLEAKSAELAALRQGHDEALVLAKEAAAAAALEAAFSTLRRHTCGVCKGTPFANVKHVEGMGLVHQNTCFELASARASSRRLEERAAGLVADVADLRAVIDGMKAAQAAAAQAGAAAPSPSPAPAPSPAPGAAATAALHARLASLVNVHRQLLRKHAVVDVEAAGLAEEVAARDRRIRELHTEALAAADSLVEARGEFERRLARERADADEAAHGLRASYEAKLVALRALFADGAEAGGAGGAGAAATRGGGFASPVHVGTASRVDLLSPQQAWRPLPMAFGEGGAAAAGRVVKPLRGGGERRSGEGV